MPRIRQPKLATLDVAEEIARRVPGYKGYQEITQRRDERASNSVRTSPTFSKRSTRERGSWNTWPTRSRSRRR